MSLDVVIVGAGIGGLTAAVSLSRAGHRVTVLEQARRLGEVGAGIQVAPNASRVLVGLGLREAIEATAGRAEASVRRRWQNGAVLGRVELGDAVEDRFGSPYWQMHRADLHAALLSEAISGRAGVPAVIRLDCEVTSCLEDEEGVVAGVRLRDGSTVAADVVIGADGVHSTVRRHVAGRDEAVFSGDNGYRALIDRSQLAHLPDVAALFEEPTLTVWPGPHAHFVHYTIRRASTVSFMAVIPGGEFDKESWSAVGDKGTLLKGFDGWDPRIRDLVGAAESVSCWALYDRRPLATWTSGRFALMGDACHPMLPYQAQGAAQAIEDADALGAALRGVDRDGVADALRTYQERRSTRAAAVQEASRRNQNLFHMNDGADQERRDAELAQGASDYESYEWLWTPQPV